jgi:hypothetical protein
MISSSAFSIFIKYFLPIFVYLQLISFQDEKMSHPIHRANDKSPYGDLTREEFYKKHQIFHQESFMFNKKNMKIFTQSWRPDSTSQPKGIVAMVHGYSSESSWLNELTAVAIAKAGFLVCALRWVSWSWLLRWVSWSYISQIFNMLLVIALSFLTR